MMNIVRAARSHWWVPFAALAVTALIPSLAGAAVGSAQTQAVAAAGDTTQIDSGGGQAGNSLAEVVVTGSRLSASFSAPTPVTSITAAQLTQRSPNDLTAALQQSPALITSKLNTNIGSASAGTGTNGQSLLDLRGLGVNRTLVLLDGERLGTTNITDSVDINIIPQNLVKRVDVVTGGASATYGSDAVAGVVNFVLDTTFHGFKANVDAGTTQYGDSTNGQISVAYGTSLGDHVNLIASATLYRRGEVGAPPTGRNWIDHPWVSYLNPSASGPTTLLLPNGRSSYGSNGGTITKVQGCAAASCQALINQQFGPGGVLEPFQVGAHPGSSFASGGDGAAVVNGTSPRENRQSAFVHVGWDVSPALTLFAEGLFSRTATVLFGQPYRAARGEALTIYRDNAFMPPDVAAVLAANPSVTSFTLQRFMPDAGVVYIHNLDQVGRVAVGAKGALNDVWSFDASLSQQYTIDNIDMNDSISRNLYAATDAVVDPATGNVVCRSTLQGYDPSCQPADFFGPNSISDAAVKYISGYNRGDTTFRQTAFEANLRGNLGEAISLGAGPISVALGMAYRHEIAHRDVDPLSNITTSCVGVRGCPARYEGAYGGYTYYNPSPLYGRTTATEGYLEFGIPLLRDLPLVESLNLDIAGRLTEYSFSGAQDSWKLGLQWKVNGGVMLRGTVSQDVRAPDVIELFNTATSLLGQFEFPNSINPLPGNVPGSSITTGNPNLKPEIAHTVTGGIVLSPSFVPGWETSLDYYHIAIGDAIEEIGTQTVVNRCSQGDQTYCKLITLDGVPLTTTTGITPATPGLLVVTAPNENVGKEGTSGFDLISDYSHPLGAGTISAHVAANYLLTKKVFNSDCLSDEVAGLIGGCTDGNPRWTGQVSLQYRTARYSAYVGEQIIGGGPQNPWEVVGVDVNRDRHVPAVFYTNLALSYNVGFGGSGQLYLHVSNLFNRAPPYQTTNSTSWIHPAIYQLYDVLGRRFLLGYRLSL